MKSSKDRSLLMNIIICLIALVGVLVIPSIVGILFSNIITNDTICSAIGELVFLLILVFLFYNDLKKEYKVFKKDIKESLRVGFKYYFVGLMAMIFFNLFLAITLKSIATNETQVREMLFDTPFFSLINIVLLAPIAEELTFRKSIRPIINNRILYAIICGVLFGLAHLLTNFLSGTFVLTDLLYVLPYGSLGFAFAIMDYDTKTTYTSICMHAFHNFCTGMLLLLVYYSGFIK